MVLHKEFKPGRSRTARFYAIKKLDGKERYRIRQGKYRIVYSIEAGEFVVYVIKIGHRKDIYRAL
jgi:mRNA interferase RelE/StbE